MKDNTKYNFEGEEYGKGRLALAVIKFLILDKRLSYLVLQERLSGIPFNGEIILDKESYDERSLQSKDIENRYFVSDMLEDSEGKAFLVSNQWGLDNIDGFIDLARNLEFAITIVSDSNSELMRMFEQYRANSHKEWIEKYRSRCDALSGIDSQSFDFSNEEFLENYWRSSPNGISGVQPGMLSVDEFDNLKSELPGVSKDIASDCSSAIYRDVEDWAKGAKSRNLFTGSGVKWGVIHRVFCAFHPDKFCTIINKGHVDRFVSKWNVSGLGPKIDNQGNWFELNARVLKSIKMRGLEGEDNYLVNTFVYKLKEHLVDGAEEPGGDDKFSKGEDRASLDICGITEGAVPASLNKILYGPPGTGKTYNTIEQAIRISDPGLHEQLAKSSLPLSERRNALKARFDDLLKSGQVAFTTFHQSFSYEDFVEGLKAESDAGEISYSVESGIFKRICERAVCESRPKGLKGAVAALKERCLEEAVILNTATGKEFSLSYKGGKTFSCMPAASNSERDLPANIDHVCKVVRGIEPENLYCASYVRAISKYLIDEYDVIHSEKVTPKTAVPHVLIIDEINRGNIAKIFGELITLLEVSKRHGMPEQLTAVLPYSKELFSVPANLHVIGTMNTADASLAKVDIALRRRFEFIETMPRAELLRGLFIDGVNIEKLLETINMRIELLYDRDHTVGHSYFMGLSPVSTLTDLASIFEKQIIPLLEEYFFEDWAQIHRVLGDHLKGQDQPKFIVKKYSDGDIQRLMGPDWQADASLQAGWKLNKSALQNPKAYSGVYAPVQREAGERDSRVAEQEIS